jgi:hypothetical protein
MRERGQTSVEWLAAMAGVASLAAAVASFTPGVAANVSATMRSVICHVGGGSCDAQAATAEQPAAPAATPQRDFCGSRYVNAPELWFTSACEGHDRCYAAHRGKAACDTAFLNDMLAACEHVGSSASGVRSGVTRASCRAAAHLYYKAVVVGGGPSYCHRLVCRDD